MKLPSSIACFLIAAGVALPTTGCSLVTDKQSGSDENVDVADHAIVGGEEAEPGAWPGTVALFSGGSQVCGGSLVADEWVLTAGHCIEGGGNGGIDTVVIGRHKLSTSEGEEIRVKKAFRHSDFNGGTLDNDIALLHLASKTTAPTVKLIDGAHGSALTEGADVTVVGWGLTSEGGWNTSDVLNQVTVPVMDNSTCKEFNQYEDLTENQVCAGLPNGGKDSCQGDSGGPLFMDINGTVNQVGLVSWGIGCARPNAPGVYTRIGNYLSWLSDTSGGAVGGGGGFGGSGDND